MFYFRPCNILKSLAIANCTDNTFHCMKNAKSLPDMTKNGTGHKTHRQKSLPFDMIFFFRICYAINISGPFVKACEVCNQKTDACKKYGGNEKEGKLTSREISSAVLVLPFKKMRDRDVHLMS